MLLISANKYYYGNLEIKMFSINDCKPACEKNILISFSLFMRLMEWSREESKSDEDLHNVMEKLMAFNDGVNPLKFDVYSCLVSDVPHEDFDGDVCNNANIDNSCVANQPNNIERCDTDYCDSDCNDIPCITFDGNVNRCKPTVMQIEHPQQEINGSCLNNDIMAQIEEIIKAGKL
jgi:hypothetical protein